MSRFIQILNADSVERPRHRSGASDWMRRGKAWMAGTRPAMTVSAT